MRIKTPLMTFFEEEFVFCVDDKEFQEIIKDKEVVVSVHAEKRVDTRWESVIKAPYCELYDAYFDGATGVWLEEPCQGVDCEFCQDRPDVHELDCCDGKGI